MPSIRHATTASDFREIGRLMRAFIAWHRERHAAEVDLIARYFDPVAFERELAGLPGNYAPPAGRLLVAECEARVVGCVALRDLGGGACEMKRMFVEPEFHGRGIGRALAGAIVAEGRAAGYACMRLDTGARQIEAQQLYRSLGFRDIAPYSALPEELKAWLVFMECELRPA